jgi:hypothetical protein
MASFGVAGSFRPDPVRAARVMPCHRRHSGSFILVGFLCCFWGWAVEGDETHYRVVKRIEKPNARSGDRFGDSIAVVGTTIAISATSDDTLADNAGAVYLFDRQGEFLHAIMSPNPRVDGFFGDYMHAVGDDKLVISAWRENGETGAAYLFDIAGNVLQTIENPTPELDDEFGSRSVTSNGSHILIAAWHDTSRGPNNGAAYLYDLEGNLQTTFVSPRPEHDCCLGRAAAFVGDDKVVITDYGDDLMGEDTGVAFLFDLQGNVLATFQNPRPDPRDVFGTAVAYAGGRILIGAAQDDNITGAAYIFDLEGNHIASIADPEPALDNWFGWSGAAVGDDRFIIGSIFNDSLAFEGGEAYLVDLEGNILYTFESPEPGVQHHFGRSFGVLEDAILIGENFHDGGWPVGKGAVWMFAPVALGDFNEDGSLNVVDLNLLCSQVSTGGEELTFDLTADGSVDGDDVTRFLELTNRLPGDGDFDGHVQFSDFVVLADNFGQAGVWSDGDFDCTGDVKFADFVILADRFGASSGGVAAAVPEPSTFGLLFGAAGLLVAVGHHLRREPHPPAK